MLGFGKKKKNKEDAASVKKDASANDKKDKKDKKAKKDKKGKSKDIPVTDQAAPKKKKRKWLSKKLVFSLLLVLMALGASSYVVYSLYFAPRDTETIKATYKKIELKHIQLPEEMIKFCFEKFPDLYVAMITYNSEINLFDQEIARIDAIGKKYPDQKKIADKEKKVWEKSKTALEKAFLKIEKPVKETYVLYKVNKDLGAVQIEAKSKELTDLLQTALSQARELTQKIKATETVPHGFLKKTIYKLKKKFL